MFLPQPQLIQIATHQYVNGHKLRSLFTYDSPAAEKAISQAEFSNQLFKMVKKGQDALRSVIVMDDNTTYVSNWTLGRIMKHMGEMSLGGVVIPNELHEDAISKSIDEIEPNQSAEED